MMKYFIACIAAGLLSACSDEPDVVVVEGVEADEVTYGGDALASGWDVDRDGLLSQTEYLNLSNTSRGMWDNDRDGSLTLAEFEPGWTATGFTNASGAFAAMDEDGDGILTQADLLGPSIWERWDSDDSGVLETSEFPYY